MMTVLIFYVCLLSELSPTIECQIENRLSDENQTPSQCGNDSGATFSALISNGHVCYDGLTIGSVATFQCDEGYKLMGNSQLWCQLDGEWDSDTPTCNVYGELCPH